MFCSLWRACSLTRALWQYKPLISLQFESSAFFREIKSFGYFFLQYGNYFIPVSMCQITLNHPICVLLPKTPFPNMVFTLIAAWKSNYVHNKVWDEITYPFYDFNSAFVVVLGIYKKFRPTHNQTCAHVFMLGSKLNHVIKRGPCAFITIFRYASITTPNSQIKGWDINSDLHRIYDLLITRMSLIRVNRFPMFKYAWIFFQAYSQRSPLITILILNKILHQLVPTFQ